MLSNNTELGSIPSEWRVAKLGDLDFDISDGNYSSKYPKHTDFTEQGIPFIRANNIKGLRVIWDDMRYISKEKHKELQKGHLKVNDILITTRGQLGNVALVSKEFEDSNINAQIVRINVKDVLNPKFFLFILSSNSLQRIISGLRTGTTLPQLPVGKLKSITLPIPSTIEQNNIVHILTQIQTAIETQEKIIQMTTELKKSLMHKLFTEGLKGEEQKETELGLVPKSWDLIKAEDYCVRITDGTHDSPKATEKGFYLVTSKNLKGRSIDFDGGYFISPDDYDEVNKRSKVDVYDILFGMIGTIGSAVLITKEPNFAIKNVGLFKVGGDKNKGLWLYHYLHSNIIEKLINEQKKGAIQKYVPLWWLRSMPILLPSEKERVEIIHSLETLDNKIEAERRKGIQLRLLFEAMLHELMTGRIRVKELS